MLLEIRRIPPDEQWLERLSIQPVSQTFSHHFITVKPSPAHPHPLRVPKGGRLLVRMESREKLSLILPAGAISKEIIIITDRCQWTRVENAALKIIEQTTFLARIRSGSLKISFLSFKSLALENRKETVLPILEKLGPGMVIADHIERLSPWGSAFSAIDAAALPVLEEIRRKHRKLVFVGLTRTRDRLVLKDISDRLDLQGPEEISSPIRLPESLSFGVVRKDGLQEKENAFEGLIWEEIPKAVGADHADGAYNDNGWGTVLEAQEKSFRLIYSDIHGKTGQGMDRAGPLKAPIFFPRYPYPLRVESGSINAFDRPFEGDKGKGGNRMPELMFRTNYDPKYAAADSGDDGGKARFALHTSLWGDLERWARRTLWAVTAGEEAHCVQVADLPAEGCRKDLENQGAEIPPCVESGCLYGKAELCDYGKMHLQIDRTIPGPVEMTSAALTAADAIFRSHERGDTPARFSSPASEAERTGIVLYHLQGLGLLENFRAREIEAEICFEIKGFRPSQDRNALVGSLWKYLRESIDSTGIGDSFFPRERLTGRFGEIARLREQYGQKIETALGTAIESRQIQCYPQCTLLIETLCDCLPVIFEPLCRRLRATARWKLGTLMNFIRAQDCRTATLLKHFRVVDEAWRCGRCDLCRPDLHFEERMPEPLEDANADEKEKILRELPAASPGSFDFDAAERLKESFSDDPENLYYRICADLAGHQRGSPYQYLAEAPEDLWALYLAHALSPAPESKKHAIDLIRTANRSRMEISAMKRFYEAADDETKPALFDILDDEYGPAASPKGEEWLCQAGAELNLEPSRLEWLHVRCFADQLAEIDFKPIRNRLHKALEELSH